MKIAREGRGMGYLKKPDEQLDLNIVCSLQILYCTIRFKQYRLSGILEDLKSKLQSALPNMVA